LSAEVATWIGTGLSALGAGVAIWQALLAKSYKEQVRVDIRKLGVLRSAEHLRRALESIRRLPSDSKKVPRGKQTETLIESIKACFDETLGILPMQGDEEDVRKNVLDAQLALTAYEHGLNSSSLTAGLTAAIQVPVQNAATLANDRILKIEGKA
jgi:citrate synthase